MKQVFIFLAAAVLFVIFCCGCDSQKPTENVSDYGGEHNTDNNGDYTGKPSDLTCDVAVFFFFFDSPVKVVYQRNYFYSALFETEDKDTINALIDALNGIEVLSETSGGVTDYDDIISFVSANGDTQTVRFEYKRLLKDDRVYEISGFDRVEAVLSTFAQEENE